MKKLLLAGLLLSVCGLLEARPLNFWSAGKTSEAVKVSRIMNRTKGLYQIKFLPGTKAGSFWFAHGVKLPEVGKKVTIATIVEAKNLQDPNAFVTLAVQGWSKKGYIGTSIYNAKIAGAKCVKEAQELQLEFSMPDPKVVGRRWDKADSLLVTLGVTANAECEFNFSDTIIERK